MEKNKLNPGSLLQLSGSYWQTCTLHAAVKLDIFTIIGAEQLSDHDIAAKMKAPVRSVSMLLNALCAMELLEKHGADGHYTNTLLSSTFLSKESPQYVGFMIMHHHHLVESWSRLDESVMSGKSVRTRAASGDEQYRESFLMGMFNIAMATAPGLVPTLDLSERKHLLDLGGGPGTYAIQFCLHNPELKAVVFDLSTTRPFAEKTISRFNQEERIKFQAGDFLKDTIEGSYDVVWLSHILHAEGAEECERLIEKAASVLTPGGMIIIHDFILNNQKDAPLFPALFCLNMLLGTQEGQAYSEKEILAMLDRRGFINLARTPYQGPTDSGIITGSLPE